MTMIRLNMIVEGKTEELFVKRMLTEHLACTGVYVSVRRVQTGRKAGRIYRGGMTNYLKAKNDIRRWMNEDKDRNARFSTMFDLYGLPKDFPGFDESGKFPDPYLRINILEKAFGDDIQDIRFVPYIQLHEYESLILTDPDKFETIFIGRSQQIANLRKMTEKLSSPELIDDGPETSPSKRIIRQIPEYETLKSTAGPLIAQKIGLVKIRRKCPHFNQWFSKLETLGSLKTGAD